MLESGSWGHSVLQTPALVFIPVNFPLISAIKLTQIEKYRLRLKERDRRKQLARHYGLITAAAQSAAAAAAAAGTPGVKATKSPYQKKRGSKEDR